MSGHNYSVFVKLSLINHASHGLNLLAKQFRGLNDDAKAFKSQLAEIGKLATKGRPIKI